MKLFPHIITCALLSILLGVSISLAEKPKKIKVHSVSIDGNQTYTDKRLRRLMLSQPSVFLKRSYYYPEVFADDLDHIINFYQQNGYLEAKIVESNIEMDSIKSIVDIFIVLDEGELTTVEGLAIFGNSVYAESALLDKIKLHVGDPFKRNEIQDGMLSMLSMYAEEGYLDAAVTPDIKINSDRHLAMVDLLVAEKNQFTIDSIHIKGLQKTHENVVTRELLFHKGEIVKYSKLQESQRRLYLTGLFESVFIRPQPAANADSTKKDILVEIKENLSSEFNAKIGYGSVEKVNGEIELLTTNLSGTARQIGANVSASFIKRRLETSFTEPWTMGTRFRTDINVFYEYVEEPGYDVSRYGGRITEGRSLSRNSNISLSYRYEDATLKAVRVVTVPDDFDSKVRSLTLSFVNDTRNNLFHPSRGTYLEWSNEFAGAFLKGNNSFLRSIIMGKWFLPLRYSIVLGSAVEIGWMDYFGSSDDIPLNERFYAGGPNALRGFEYQMVGPLQGNDVPLGGKFKMVWDAIEIRKPVYKIIGVGVFGDVGNVWSNIEHARIADIRSCIGAGIRANTSIGILRLDYGFNLDPRAWEPPGMLYFSMGHAF